MASDCFPLVLALAITASPRQTSITDELRTLIHRLAQESPGWGAPKMHGELLKLGFVLCERTVARYLRRVRRRGDPTKNWLTSLENHREVIAALDFFTVPTITFQLLYCLFLIHHGRCKILHFNVTRHPTAEWTLQQLREAFPDALGCRYVILDHDSKFALFQYDSARYPGRSVGRTQRCIIDVESGDCCAQTMSAVWLRIHR